MSLKPLFKKLKINLRCFDELILTVPTFRGGEFGAPVRFLAVTALLTGEGVLNVNRTPISCWLVMNIAPINL